MKKDVLIYLNTFKRYDSTLPLAILSVINQTYKFDKFIIFDDNKDENKKDLRTIEHYKYLFDMMDQKGINWEYRFGHQKGAHFNHEDANLEGFKYAFFIDDDEVLEPNTLDELMKCMTDDVGAVGGLILQPPTRGLPEGLSGKMSDVFNGQNIAWYIWNGEPKEVEHLFSSFLYRCNIVHHDLRLSSVVFRGETMFTHSLFLKGYKLICTPKAITWHFQTRSSGGIHDGQKIDNWNYDNNLFLKWLEFKKSGKKLYLIREGLGDNYAFKQVITPEKDSIVATCFPHLYPDNECISIGDAEQLVDPKDYKIYEWGDRYGGSLLENFKKLYAHLDHKRK